MGYIAGVRAPDIRKQGHGCLSIVSLGISHEPSAFQTSIHAARTVGGAFAARAFVFPRGAYVATAAFPTLRRPRTTAVPPATLPSSPYPEALACTWSPVARESHHPVAVVG